MSGDEKLIYSIASIDISAIEMDGVFEVLKKAAVDFGGIVDYCPLEGSDLRRFYPSGAVEHLEHLDKRLTGMKVHEGKFEVYFTSVHISLTIMDRSRLCAMLKHELEGEVKLDTTGVPNEHAHTLPPIAASLDTKSDVIFFRNYGPRSHALFNVTPELGNILTRRSFLFNNSLTYRGHKVPGYVVRLDETPVIEEILQRLGVAYINETKSLI